MAASDFHCSARWLRCGEDVCALSCVHVYLLQHNSLFMLWKAFAEADNTKWKNKWTGGRKLFHFHVCAGGTAGRTRRTKKWIARNKSCFSVLFLMSQFTWKSSRPHDALRPERFSCSRMAVRASIRRLWFPRRKLFCFNVLARFVVLSLSLPSKGSIIEWSHRRSFSPLKAQSIFSHTKGNRDGFMMNAIPPVDSSLLRLLSLSLSSL